ncbi:MAG TPA: DUF3135 domain-containing protein [Rhodocyclaceae bacterium]|nr:DUF3135 domain-containing protein [Rhodocyclaceae bacterium]
MDSTGTPFDTLQRLAREDEAAFRAERQRLIEEYLQSRASDALNKLQDEIDWLRAMNTRSAAGWPEVWKLLRDSVDSLADKVNLLARELRDREGP